MLAVPSDTRTLPRAVICPECEQPMGAAGVVLPKTQADPVGVNYLCRTADCQVHEFLVFVL